MHPAPSASAPFSAVSESQAPAAYRQRLETLGVIAGSLASDLDELLAALLFSLTSARRALAPEHPVAHSLHAAEQAGRRAAELTRRLVNFASDHDESETTFDLVALVEEALPLLRAALPEEIELNGRFDITSGLVHGHTRLLQQVVLTLALDSAQFLAGRPSHLELAVRRVPAEQTPTLEVGRLARVPHLCISILDTGPAGSELPADERVRNARPRGQSLLRSIILRHHGALTIRSGPGTGHLVEVYLPECTAAEAPRPAGNRILVIDDEETVVRLALQALDYSGYQTHALSSPRECLELLAREPRSFDLIMTDQRMPTMSGVEMVQALRLQGDRTPVLITSGSIAAVSARELEELAPARFIAKPFTLTELLDAVENLVGSASPSTGA